MTARLLLVPAAVAAALAAAAPVAAAPVDAGTRSISVAAGDLDLGAAVGLAELEQRIGTAAARVCIADSHDMRSMRAAQACRRAALGSAMSKVRAVVAAQQTRKQLATRGIARDASLD